MNEIETQVMAIVADVLNVPVDTLSLDTAFVADLEADSLDMITMVMEAEHYFEIGIPDKDATALKTIGNAVAYIQKAVTR